MGRKNNAVWERRSIGTVHAKAMVKARVVVMQQEDNTPPIFYPLNVTLEHGKS